MDFHRPSDFVEQAPKRHPLIDKRGPVAVGLKTAEDKTVAVELDDLFLIVALEVEPLQAEILKILFRRPAHLQAKLLPELSGRNKKTISLQPRCECRSQRLFFKGRGGQRPDVDDAFDDRGTI